MKRYTVDFVVDNAKTRATLEASSLYSAMQEICRLFCVSYTDITTVELERGE